ncbi:MAG TPA: folylpolyglutamate synthase/dihydrofolate synthase family protein [Pirellulales bacterium]|jgi:dihydrofolate synthase/folylpolyglutamate synthase|nr:folylpolyglutamate synthase/dihydrofolate synthase family protein [Pirellulales bacterium]
MQRTPATADYDGAIDFLLSRIDYERMLSTAYGERDLKLERMHELVERLGNPERAMPIVHIAGTKGKGSTAAMTAAMLTAAGYRTGLYTSPHLARLEERMTVDGQQCSADEMIALVGRVQPAVAAMDAAAGGSEHGPTYFEIVTALALLHFARRQVDLAVLEVGLGGRLDSTNICQPLVSVITSISFDHTRQLGNTLGAIAGEKAGIIKPGAAVVSGVMQDEPRAVVTAAARRHGCRLLELGRDFSYAYHSPGPLDVAGSRPTIDFDYRVADFTLDYRGLELALIGEHQAANAALALAVLVELARSGFVVPEPAVRAGLATVQWPARLEILGRRPLVVVDAAHNVASIEAFLATLDQSFAARPRVLVFATTCDKDVRGMLGALVGRFERIIFTRYQNNPRGLPADELMALTAELGPQACQVAADPRAAWEAARRCTPAEGLIAITGSFFIAAEMRPLVLAAVQNANWYAEPRPR